MVQLENVPAPLVDDASSSDVAPAFNWTSAAKVAVATGSACVGLALAGMVFFTVRRVLRKSAHEDNVALLTDEGDAQYVQR